MGSIQWKRGSGRGAPPNVYMGFGDFPENNKIPSDDEGPLNFLIRCFLYFALAFFIWAFIFCLTACTDTVLATQISHSITGGGIAPPVFCLE